MYIGFAKYGWHTHAKGYRYTTTLTIGWQYANIKIKLPKSDRQENYIVVTLILHVIFFFQIFDNFSINVFSVKRQHKGKTQNKKVLLTLPHLSLTMTIQWFMKVVLIKVKSQRPCAPMCSCSNHKLLRALLASLWSFGGCANSFNEFFILRAFSSVVRPIITFCGSKCVS